MSYVSYKLRNPQKRFLKTVGFNRISIIQSIMSLELKHFNYECWLYRNETQNILKYITCHNFELREYFMYEYLMCNEKKEQ